MDSFGTGSGFQTRHLVRWSVIQCRSAAGTSLFAGETQTPFSHIRSPLPCVSYSHPPMAQRVLTLRETSVTVSMNNCFTILGPHPLPSIHTCCAKGCPAPGTTPHPCRFTTRFLRSRGHRRPDRRQHGLLAVMLL